MKCQKCLNEFEQIEVSHDVPTYIFEGERKERERQADKYGRHNLCKKCHDIYESIVFSEMIREADHYTKIRMIKRAQQFAQEWFSNKKERENGSGAST